MANLKRLAKRDDNIAIVHIPVSTEEFTSRTQNYPLLTPAAFSKKYRDSLFQPVFVTYNGEEFSLQVNHCTDPFCRWFGMPQETFATGRKKPSRYKLSGTDKYKNQVIICNPDQFAPDTSHWGHTSKTLSNWSVAEEIARLATNDRVVKWEPEYEFHREGCTNKGMTPFEFPKEFYKQGKSVSNSQRWQCKVCKKKTNVLPKQRQSYSYHQKRNDILPLYARCLLSRVPVKRTCDILEIGSETYYNKLEWLYQQCLKFLERYEQKAFQNRQFERMWIDSDQLIYYMNNIKKRGHGGGSFQDAEDPLFPTYVMVSGDVFSTYIFRSDVAYDWRTTLEDIQLQTVNYKDDHLPEFARKYGGLRFSVAPQQPTEIEDSEDAQWEYINAKHEFDLRRKYIDGMHVNQSYTAIAHYWLIRQMIHANKWRVITDSDNALISAAYRVFMPEFRDGKALHFTCKVDRKKTRQEGKMERKDAWENLRRWGHSIGQPKASMSVLATRWLEAELKNHKFHIDITRHGSTYRRWANNPIEHPLPTSDKGYYTVDCTSDVSGYDTNHLARLLLRVNNNATNAFMQQIRRRISILERPLVTARGDGKSYIYANFNPKYAQYALTILRTYYNFCFEIRGRNGEKATPAQHLGIADRKFELKDIIYFR